MRTHKNNELRKEDVDKTVTLNGWVHTRRDHGGIIFIDLRDRYGFTQLVFDPEFNNEFIDLANTLRREFCIEISGIVKLRKEGMSNPNLETGDIEIFVNILRIINKSDVPPIEIEDRIEAGEDLRLKYRFLDLRRPIMQKRLLIRHKAAMATRNYLSSKDFLEIETPLLVKSTPEGARDYIVPSRVNPGLFYALPQSPQLYKQILMVSGFDRYFQIAKCLRDEDLRSDRQPEFTQIDLEMSFPTQDEIFKIGEGLIQTILKETIDKDVKIPFQRINYEESMNRFGCDKPDLRFGLELTEVTEIAIKSEFGVFKDVRSNGGIVKCICPQKDFGRKEIDGYIEFCQSLGAKGMAWMRVTENGLESNIAKYFSSEVQKELIQKTNAKSGSIIMFIADKPNKCNDILAKFRNKLGLDLKLYDEKEFEFAWVVDFPLFEKDEETGNWTPAHHMFTMPREDCLEFIEESPEKVIAQCYDLVLNGVEMASGSIRVHRPDIQERIMNKVGFPKEKAQERFGFLLDAFKYGAPSHGGFGIGFDRLVAMIQGLSDIRDVMAFPKNKNAECPMDGSPNVIEEKQLKELNLKYSEVAEKNIKKRLSN